VHGEAGGDLGAEGGGEGGVVEGEAVEVPLDAHEELAGGVVAVFVGGEDVGAVAEEEAGDGGDEASGVGAVDEEDGAIGGDHTPMVACGGA